MAETIGFNSSGQRKTRFFQPVNKEASERHEEIQKIQEPIPKKGTNLVETIISPLTVVNQSPQKGKKLKKTLAANNSESPLANLELGLQTLARSFGQIIAKREKQTKALKKNLKPLNLTSGVHLHLENLVCEAILSQPDLASLQKYSALTILGLHKEKTELIEQINCLEEKLNSEIDNTKEIERNRLTLRAELENLRQELAAVKETDGKSITRIAKLESDKSLLEHDLKKAVLDLNQKLSVEEQLRKSLEHSIRQQKEDPLGIKSGLKPLALAIHRLVKKRDQAKHELDNHLAKVLRQNGTNMKVDVLVLDLANEQNKNALRKKAGEKLVLLELNNQELQRMLENLRHELDAVKPKPLDISIIETRKEHLQSPVETQVMQLKPEAINLNLKQAAPEIDECIMVPPIEDFAVVPAENPAVDSILADFMSQLKNLDAQNLVLRSTVANLEVKFFD